MDARLLFHDVDCAGEGISAEETEGKKKEEENPWWEGESREGGRILRGGEIAARNSALQFQFQIIQFRSATPTFDALLDEGSLGAPFGACSDYPQNQHDEFGTAAEESRNDFLKASRRIFGDYRTLLHKWTPSSIFQEEVLSYFGHGLVYLWPEIWPETLGGGCSGRARDTVSGKCAKLFRTCAFFERYSPGREAFPVGPNKDLQQS
ncbi:hypothetical protein KM043_016404 [Ampulex compressa]|nr:hypothetical protein KM043_016404 [Ampulex compressa]